MQYIFAYTKVKTLKNIFIISRSKDFSSYDTKLEIIKIALQYQNIFFKRVTKMILTTMMKNQDSDHLCVLVSQLCLTLCDPMDCSPPDSYVHGILQQEYWSGLPFLSPGGLPVSGIKPKSPALQANSLPSELQESHVYFKRRTYLYDFSFKNGQITHQCGIYTKKKNKC